MNDFHSQFFFYKFAFFDSLRKKSMPFLWSVQSWLQIECFFIKFRWHVEKLTYGPCIYVWAVPDGFGTCFPTWFPIQCFWYLICALVVSHGGQYIILHNNSNSLAVPRYYCFICGEIKSFLKLKPRLKKTM